MNPEDVAGVAACPFLFLSGGLSTIKTKDIMSIMGSKRRRSGKGEGGFTGRLLELHSGGIVKRHTLSLP